MTSQFKAECLLTLRVLFRQPGFWVPTILFPAMLYTFFGAQSGGTQWAANAMASFCIYAVVGVGFFQFGVGLAQDRESPFEAWQRTLPSNLTAQWSARIVAAVMITALAVALVVVVALVLAAVRLDAAAWVRLVLVCLIAVVPATLLGIALGSVASARAAVPVANVVFLPLAYLGGLWVPPAVMPEAVSAISEWTPTRAMGELSWAAVSGEAFAWSYVVLLLAWTLAAAALASVVQLRRSL